MYLRIKFVDEFYFSLGGLPGMNVFGGAWGYKTNAGDIGEQTDEFAAAIQRLANCNFVIISRYIGKRVTLPLYFQ